MTVIYIFGASGSGTSTLGKKISEMWGYTWLDTDDYFWLLTNPPYTTHREKSERVRMMKEEIETHENIVISGCIANWGNELIPYFTLAVRVVTPTNVRLERIKKREYDRFGEQIRPGGTMYEHHMDFLEWAGKYDIAGVEMRSRARHDEWQKLLTCPLVVAEGTADLTETCEKIKQKVLQININR